MTSSQFKESAKETVKKVIISLKRTAKNHPKLAVILLQILELFPGIQKRLDRIGKPLHRIPTITKQEQLSPQSRRIYESLDNAIKAYRGRSQ